MKLTYTPKNTIDTFVIEGTTDEIVDLVTALAPTNVRPTSQVAKPNLNNIGKNVPNTSDSNTGLGSNPKNEMAFLKSIYLYAPNPNTDGGRGAYIAKQILDNKTVNIASLVKKSKCSPDTITKVVNRMRDAGANVKVTNTTVTLVSLPDGPFEPKKYTRSNKKNIIVKNTILDKFSAINAN